MNFSQGYLQLSLNPNGRCKAWSLAKVCFSTGDRRLIGEAAAVLWLPAGFETGQVRSLGTQRVNAERHCCKAYGGRCRFSASAPVTSGARPG